MMTTILLVEDEARLAQTIICGLGKHGYTILHAADGQAAMRLMEQHHPDLVILDWVFPALVGMQVLRRLRQVSSAPVLMLTARDEVADQGIGLELGADDYLTKPFDMVELARRVHTLLRRVERVQRIVSQDREKRPQPLTYQDLTLDPRRRQVTIVGQPVDLTALEFGLLTLLFRNPGRVFSRAYLLETLWEGIPTQGERSVDDAVLRLQEKLAPRGELIETVRGVGYRLRAS